MAKYLDNNGLLYFWQQLKTILAGKVDVVSGKGLSTNDYTTTEKNKLGGIASGAEVNKIDSITYNGNTVTITSKTASITGPTKTSDLTNDSGYITSADVPEGAAASTTTPKMDGTAAVGTETAFARGDHRHPSDTSRQAKITASGMLKGDGNGGVTAAVAGTDYLTTHQDISGKLDKSGGTMTGALTLSGDPTSNLHAATKKYVDDSVPDISGKANIASPEFTGTPKAPTATVGTNTTQIATTAFVATAVANASTGAAKFQGDLNAQSTLSDADYKTGWYWVVGTAGTYAGEVCEVGDMVYAVEDKGSAYAASDFTVIQTNLDIVSITNAEIDTIIAS